LAQSFRLPFLPPYIIPLILNIITSALKMEAVCFSKTLASTDQSTQCQNPEEHYHYHHCCENLKSHTEKSMSMCKYMGELVVLKRLKLMLLILKITA
jgi:hypothetical protein